MAAEPLWLGDLDAGLLAHLAAHGCLGALADIDKAGEGRIHIRRKVAGAAEQDLVAAGDAHNHGGRVAGIATVRTLRTGAGTFVGEALGRRTADATKTMRPIPLGQLEGAARHGPLGVWQSPVEWAQWLVDPAAWQLRGSIDVRGLDGMAGETAHMNGLGWYQSS